MDGAKLQVARGNLFETYVRRRDRVGVAVVASVPPSPPFSPPGEGMHILARCLGAAAVLSPVIAAGNANGSNATGAPLQFCLFVGRDFVASHAPTTKNKRPAGCSALSSRASTISRRVPSLPLPRPLPPRPNSNHAAAVAPIGYTCVNSEEFLHGRMQKGATVSPRQHSPPRPRSTRPPTAVRVYQREGRREIGHGLCLHRLSQSQVVARRAGLSAQCHHGRGRGGGSH